MKIISLNYNTVNMNAILIAAFLVAAKLSLAQAPSSLPQTVVSLETEKKVDQLFLLIQKRLSVMHQVAQTKWNQNLPIEDLPREKQILQGLVDQTKNLKTDEKWIARFFQAQMDAAKAVQKNDFDFWKRREVQKIEGAIPLSDLRGYIDGINKEMIDLLGQIPDPERLEFLLDRPISARKSDFVDQTVWNIAISPWKSSFHQKEETFSSK